MRIFLPADAAVAAGACLIVHLLAAPVATAAPPNATPAASPAASPNQTPAPPQPPFLKPVPDRMRWTLTTTRKHEDAKATPQASASPSADNGNAEDKAKGPIATVIGERLGKAAHLLTVHANGSRQEKWTDGKLLATSGTGTKGPYFTTEGIDKMPAPGWISRENFSETKQQGDKKYHIFKARILPTGLEVVQDMEAQLKGKADDTESMKVDALAVIDDETRLPVAVKEGDLTTTYKFEPLAPDAQIIPAEIQTALAEREKKMQETTRKPVRP